MRMVKRCCALLLALLILPVGASASKTKGFSDVPGDHWAYKSVLRAEQLGLVKGKGNGTFGLGSPVTCAEYAAMLCRLMEWEEVTPEKGSFTDNQDPQKWYYTAIETANAHGALIAHGMTCRPDEVLRREELAAMTVRALGYTTLAGTVQEECPFSDVTTNRGYVTLAQRMGLVNGVGGSRFAPRDTSAREQAAVILLRTYDRMHASVERRQGAAPAGAAEALPVNATGGSVPLSPRAGMDNVYAAAVQAGEGGAVVLHTAPYEQQVVGSEISEGKTVTTGRLNWLLSGQKTEVYRSARYASSYLIHKELDGSLTVVWYESEEDIGQKLDLCRMLGISAVYITD